MKLRKLSKNQIQIQLLQNTKQMKTIMDMLQDQNKILTQLVVAMDLLDKKGILTNEEIMESIVGTEKELKENENMQDSNVPK